MSGEQNWKVPTNFDDYMSQQARRQGQEERRPQVRKASDLLGPGIAPYAVPIDDFDSDVAAFNGFFIAEPLADVSPDATKWWVGQTVADQFNGGLQMFSTFQAADAVGGKHRLVMRSFALAPDSNLRFYSTWQTVNDAPVEYQPVTLDPVSPFTSGGIILTRIGDVVYASGGVARSSGSSTSFVQAVETIPVGLRPSGVQTPPASPQWLAPYGSIIWQTQIQPTGAITIRMSDAATNTMGFTHLQWVTTDDPGGLTPV